MTVTPMRDRGRWCEEHQRRECVSPRSHGRGPCHSDKMVTGSDKCRMHLGEKARPVIAEAKLQEQAAKLLYQRDTTPVSDPLTALQKLAGQAIAWMDIIGDLVNGLQSSLRYTDAKGAEQLRSEVAMMERGMDRTGKLLVDIAKLDIEGRLAGIRQQTADMLERALDAALEKAEVGLDKQAEARETFRRNLKVVA